MTDRKVENREHIRQIRLHDDTYERLRRHAHPPTTFNEILDVLLDKVEQSGITSLERNSSSSRREKQ